jgi:hypothetical protein
MAERQVLGQHLVWLALYRLVHPEGTIAEARAFLSNMDPTIAPFPPSNIVRAEHILDLWRKALSTTCERAYWQMNLHKRDMFWLWNYPFGRTDINTSDMIDMDEYGLKIENSNPSFGKSISWERCHFEGHTTKRGSSTSSWQSVPIKTTTWSGTSFGHKKRGG